MDEVRADHTATLLPSGKVLVVGGRNTADYTFSPTGQLYDSEMRTWTAADRMWEERAEHTATLLYSGEVLVTGGRNASTALASAELFTE
jgi:hypothetical protein